MFDHDSKTYYRHITKLRCTQAIFVQSKEKLRILDEEGFDVDRNIRWNPKYISDLCLGRLQSLCQLALKYEPVY